MARPREAHPAAVSPAGLDIANRVFFRLYQSSNLMHKAGASFLSGFGCTTQQWAALAALARPAARNGVTVKDLIGFLMVSRQNLTPVLDRLEDRGWIERVPDGADRRSRLVRMTGDGRAVWARMQEPIAAFHAGALAGFSLDEQVAFYRLLDRLKDRLSGL